MPKYMWRSTGPVPTVAADVFGAEVEKIESAKNSPVTPKDIVKAAANQRSPIHDQFEWNDRICGEKYRVQQARAMLGALQLVRVRMADGRREPSKALYNVKTENGRVYAPHSTVMSDIDLRTQLLQQAKLDLLRYLQRYEHVVAMAKHIPNIKEVLSSIEADIDSLNHQAQATKSRKRTRETAIHVPS